MNISKFKHFIKCRNQSGNRSSGGLSVYILNQKIAKGVTYIPSENKNIIWCKLDKTYFNFQKDIYLCGASQREREGRGKRRENVVFFSPPPPSRPFPPCTYPKGCYFYSPQSSSVLKSKSYNNTKMNKLWGSGWVAVKWQLINGQNFNWQLKKSLKYNWQLLYCIVQLTLPWVLLTTDKELSLISYKTCFKALNNIVPLFSSDDVIKCAFLG